MGEIYLWNCILQINQIGICAILPPSPSISKIVIFHFIHISAFYFPLNGLKKYTYYTAFCTKNITFNVFFLLFLIVGSITLKSFVTACLNKCQFIFVFSDVFTLQSFTEESVSKRRIPKVLGIKFSQIILIYFWIC